MKKTSPYKYSLIALAACSVLLISALIGGGMAKYVQRVADKETGAEVSIGQVEGNTDFALVENGVKMENDGSYTQETSVKIPDGKAVGVDYQLIPGTVLPKNPSVSVSNKTELPAYLYLVVDGLQSTAGDVTYALADGWTAVPDAANTYVYQEDGSAPKRFNSGTTTDIQILKDDRLVVENLQKLTDKTDLTILCYLVQIMNEAEDDISNAKTVWNAKGGLVDTTAKLINTFKAASVACGITEEGWTDGNTEKISIKIDNNESTIPVLIRARLVANWVDTDGNIVANPGVSVDVSASIDAEETGNWQEIDGYYYYKGTVLRGGSVELLRSPIQTVSSEYTLQVEVIAEAIQATGHERPLAADENNLAVTLAWGHYFDGTDWQ